MKSKLCEMMGKEKMMMKEKEMGMNKGMEKSAARMMKEEKVKRMRDKMKGR